MDDRHTDAPGQVRHERNVRWGWWFFAAIALFYLLAEHRAHFFGVLPYLLLLACPVMHLFMHHGHRGHHGYGKDAKSINHTPNDGREAGQ